MSTPSTFYTPSSYYTPSVVNTPSSLVNTVINNSNLSHDQKIKISESFTTKIIIFFIQCAPLVSGYGAMCYGTGTFVNVDVNSIITNNTSRIIINIFIFICGLITVLEGIFIDMMIDIIRGFLI